MKNKDKKIIAELYSIYKDVYATENERLNAVSESMNALSLLRQHKLFRKLNNYSHE